MGKKKITKKLNKKRIVNKRVVKKKPDATKKISPEQMAKTNDMLKIMLAKQQPTIPTADANILAMRHKQEQMEEKQQRQIDAMANRLAEKEREHVGVNQNLAHQRQMHDMQDKIKFTQNQIDNTNQQIKDNAQYQIVKGKADELVKMEAEHAGLQAIINSPEFQKPKEAIAKKTVELETAKQAIADQNAIIDLITENRRQEAILLGKTQANRDRYEVKRPRYDKRFVVYENNQPKKHFLTQQDIDEGRPMYSKEGNKPDGNVVYNKLTKHFIDSKGNVMYGYEYHDNMKTDYEMYQIQFREQQNIANDLANKQAIQDYRAQKYDEMVQGVGKMKIDNRMTKNDIKMKEALNDQYKDGSQQMQQLTDEYKQAGHEKAVLDSRNKLADEKNRALEQQMEAMKQEEYLKKQKEIFDSQAHREQENEIAATRVRTDQYNRSKEALQNEIVAKQQYDKYLREKALLDQRIAAAGQNVSPEDLAAHMTQVVNDETAIVKDSARLNAYAEYTTRTQNLRSQSNRIGVFGEVLGHLGININELDGKSGTTEAYVAANKLIDPITEYLFDQNDNRTTQEVAESLQGLL